MSVVKINSLLLVILLLQVASMRGQDLVWARQIGGEGNDIGAGVAVDSSGNIYTTGGFTGTVDFDPGPGVFNLTSAGQYRTYVVKLDSGGNFVWARRFNGTDSNSGHSVAADHSGNVYTTGVFTGTADFDPGPGIFNLSSVAEFNIFISKLDSSGNFVWARRMGGPELASGEGVAADSSGNVYTTGLFFGTADFDPGPNVFNLTSAGSADVFLSKLDSGGNFVWAHRIGGLDFDRGNDVAVDGSGNVYATGGFTGTVDFDPGPGIFNLPSTEFLDVFISKLNSAGDLVWAHQIGGDISSDVFVAGNGNVNTTGYFTGTVDFDPSPGVFNLTAEGLIGSQDMFVSELDATGDFVSARRRVGGAGALDGSVTVDGNGNVYATGMFTDIKDFDTSSSVFNLSSAGSLDIYVAKYKDDLRTDGPPAITTGGIVLANLLPTVSSISPLSIISVFGQNVSNETVLFPNLDGQGKLATILGGTCLTMNGEALPIFAVTPDQINAQVSATKALGPASFTVIANCGTAQAVTSDVAIAMIEEATPGFFLYPPLSNNGLIAARFNADDVAVAPSGMFTDVFGGSRPAKAGDIIVLYGTGWGDTTAALGLGELATGAAQLLPAANPTVSFGGIFLPPEGVLYVGVTPGTAGLYQLAIRVPAVSIPGNYQVVLTVYGKSTPIGPFVPVTSP